MLFRKAQLRVLLYKIWRKEDQLEIMVYFLRPYNLSIFSSNTKVIRNLLKSMEIVLHLTLRVIWSNLSLGEVETH